jgi:hypothetical protein
MARKIEGKKEVCDQPLYQKHSETYTVESGSRANFYGSVRMHGGYPHEQVNYVDSPKQKPRLGVTLPTEDVAPPSPTQISKNEEIYILTNSVEKSSLSSKTGMNGSKWSHSLPKWNLLARKSEKSPPVYFP